MKNGEIVSYKFRAYLDRDKTGKQKVKYCTWKAPEHLSAKRAEKAAQKAAEQWEQANKETK